jgi:hypothetical protein
MFDFTDPALLARATNDMLKYFEYESLFPFVPQWLFIVTWSNVTFSGGKDNTVSFEWKFPFFQIFSKQTFVV